MRPPFVTAFHGFSSKAVSNVVRMMSGSGKVDFLSTRSSLGRRQHNKHEQRLPSSVLLSASRRDTLKALLHSHGYYSMLPMAGKCVYYMLFLAHSCCRVWSSSITHNAAQSHFATLHASFATVSKSHGKQITELGMKQELQQETMAVNNDEVSLVSRIRDAYKVRETDGILELAKTLTLDECNPQEIISSSIRASNNHKGKAAGMLNAWIGSCYEMHGGAEFALQLLEAYDAVSEEIQLYPDIVTLSLVYSIACREEKYQEMAQSVLERAAKMSKKQSGSKRRKELAAARRRGPRVSCKEVEQELQALHGGEFQILQESDDFVVVSKPSGMVCFHKHKTTAGKTRQRSKGRQDNKDVSLVDALMQQNVPLSTLNPEGRGLVHRIDRGTSGCIVLAKTDEAHAKLLAQFFLRRAKKSYIALILSKDAIEPLEGEIDIPVDGRPAKSKYRILECYENMTKLHIETLTGRKHQVRVHCANGLGCPIALDSVYGSKSGVSAADDRFLLHASSLSIPDMKIEVETTLPLWWKDAVSEL